MTQQIILRELQRPREIRLEQDIEWLANSFGFTEGRDVDRITQQILHAVLHEVAEGGPTSTDRIADELDIATQRVNYHLKTLMESGFLYRERRLIFIRQGSVSAAVEEMRKDANRIFDSLAAIAEEIDRNLGIKTRNRSK
jgi:predicted transcriptional regulator